MERYGCNSGCLKKTGHLNEERGKRVAHFRKLIRQCTSADGEEYYPIPDSQQPEILDALDEACDLLESAQSETGDTLLAAADAIEAHCLNLRDPGEMAARLRRIATDRHRAENKEG